MFFLTPEQMAEVDSTVTREFGIELSHLMELSGFQAAEACALVLKDLSDKRITVLCGKGNNGGDGLACARHLHGRGAKVTIILSSPEASELGKPHLKAAKFLGMPVHVFPEGSEYMKKADIIVDGLLGYGLGSQPREPIKSMIELANRSGRPVLSIDVPSGLDALSGKALFLCVKAFATVTLGLPKAGLLRESAKEYVGRLYLADIGIPPKAYEKFGIDASKIFGKGSLIEVR